MFVNDTNVPLRNIFILKGLSLSSTEVIILNNNYLISGSTNKTDLLTNEMTKIIELTSKVDGAIRSSVKAGRVTEEVKT